MLDLFYLLLGIAFFVVPIVVLVKVIKNIGKGKKKSVIEKKDIGSKIKKEKKEKMIKLDYVRHIEGIAQLSEEDCNLCADSKELTIKTSIGNFNISLDRILNVGIFNKEEIEQKNKSVVGRALVGSMVGLGLLGALSGVGQKVKTKYNYFLVINYKDKSTEEIKVLIFGLGQYISSGQLFVNQISKRISAEKVNIDL